MRVVALVGSSGTGKSHLASYLLNRENIDYLIDDGLVITGNRVLAGRSAKRELTKMAATRRAIFQDPEHAGEAMKALHKEKPESILIVAISKKMASRITKTLELPEPQEIVHISEISTEENIRKAKEIRLKENRHVIPLPTFAIKKDFPGFLVDPILSFFGKGQHPQPRPKEQSIVRPMYSTIGNFYLSEHVITEIISYLAEETPGIYRILHIHLNSTSNGLVIDMEVSLYYGTAIHRILSSLQKTIQERVEYLAGFSVREVNIQAQKIEPLPKPDKFKAVSHGSGERKH